MSMARDGMVSSAAAASTPGASTPGASTPGASTSNDRGPRGARILIIDDEQEIRRAVRAGLTANDLLVEGAATGAQGLDLVARWHPDVVILDLALPDMDGLQVCQQLRAWTPVPIIVLSVRTQDEQKIAALDQGADDYLTKPFSMGELRARVRVALRHAAQSAAGLDPSTRFAAGELAIDFDCRTVTINTREVHLTPTEYNVLTYLARNAGHVVSHRALLRAVWGPSYEMEAHYLRVFINQLRRKIEPDPSRPRLLLTEPGVGYRLRAAE